MTMAAAMLSALLLWQGADDQKVGDLIRDLGADEYSVRERAERELRKLGDAAVPALREALEDKDPERALRAHRVLEDLEKKGQRPDQEPRSRSRAWMAYRDFGRGITFETHPDGKVELTVREPGNSGKRDTRTYRADSIEDFKKKYPDLASKYDVDNLVPKEKWSFFDDSKDSFEAWKKRFGNEWFWDKDAFSKFVLPWFPFGSGAPEHWAADPLKRFEEFRKIAPSPQGEPRSGKPQLGIVVERVSSALADQLGLGSDEGLVVADVKPSSPAERAGLRKHDILVKVNGKALTGPEELRRDVEAGLRSGMELDILRRGKRETVKVVPSASLIKVIRGIRVRPGFVSRPDLPSTVTLLAKRQSPHPGREPPLQVFFFQGFARAFGRGVGTRFAICNYGKDERVAPGGRSGVTSFSCGVLPGKEASPRPAS
jgi:hypothetical protein